jgi:hypothetical protein
VEDVFLESDIIVVDRKGVEWIAKRGDSWVDALEVDEQQSFIYSHHHYSIKPVSRNKIKRAMYIA